MGNQLLARIRLTIICFVLGLSICAGLSVSGHLSPRGFGISVLILAFAAVIVLTRFFYRMRDLPASQDPFHPSSEDVLRQQMRTTKTMLTILIVCLLLGLWETRSGPIYPHLAAIAIGLFFITISIRSLRRGHAKLKQLENRRTP